MSADETIPMWAELVVHGVVTLCTQLKLSVCGVSGFIRPWLARVKPRRKGLWNVSLLFHVPDDWCVQGHLLVGLLHPQIDDHVPDELRIVDWSELVLAKEVVLLLRRHLMAEDLLLYLRAQSVLKVFPVTVRLGVQNAALLR
jgi:hypothetical protein